MGLVDNSGGTIIHRGGILTLTGRVQDTTAAAKALVPSLGYTVTHALGDALLTIWAW